MAGAQEKEGGSLFERLNLDRLRLSGIGVSSGVVRPTQIEATESYSVHADYGEIVPQFRVVFVATYWSSRFTDATTNRFRDTLQTVVSDPEGNATVDIGRIRVSDVALNLDVRWSPRRAVGSVFRPYVGAGGGAHVINAEGRAINGTFVEQALDNITAGVAASAGLDVILLRRISIGMQARYDLLSGARFGSVRAVGSYLLRPRTGRAAR